MLGLWQGEDTRAKGGGPIRLNLRVFEKKLNVHCLCHSLVYLSTELARRAKGRGSYSHCKYIEVRTAVPREVVGSIKKLFRVERRQKE